MSVEILKKVQPLGDRIFVHPAQKEEVTSSGIIIPDTATKERSEQGVVVAVGPGEINESGQRVTVQVKIGQKVMFTKYGPSEIEIDGEEYLVIREKEILAVINE